MQTVDEPIETIHVYYEREKEKSPLSFFRYLLRWYVLPQLWE